MLRNYIYVGVLLFLLSFILDNMEGSFKSVVPFVRFVVLPALFILAFWQSKQLRIRQIRRMVSRLFR